MSSHPEARAANALTFLVRAMIYELWVVAATGVGVTVVLFFALGSGMTDLALRLRGVGATSGDVAQVSIGPEALYLWDPSSPAPEVTPRALLAEIVSFLNDAGATVVVLDFLLDTPEEGDAQLILASRAHGRVVAAERYEISERASGRVFQPGISAMFSGALYGGFANLYQRNTLLSADLLVRGAPLIKRVDRARVSGRWPENLVGSQLESDAVVPSMALMAAWLYSQHSGGQASRVLTLETSVRELCGGKTLRCSKGLEALGLPRSPTPLHEVLPINFRGPESADPLYTVRAADILRMRGQTALMRQLGVEEDTAIPEAYRAALNGKLVVVGRAGTADRFITPFGFPAYLTADMAGFRVQAQLIDTLLSGQQMHAVGGLWAWLGGLLGFGATLGTFRRRGSDLGHVLVGLALCGAMLGTSMWIFIATDGVLLEVGLPIAGILVGLLWVHLHAWAVEAMS